jgi:hypothetical protein
MSKFKKQPEERLYVLQWFSPAANAWQGMEHFKTSGRACFAARKYAEKNGWAMRVMLMERWIIFSVESEQIAGKAKR